MPLYEYRCPACSFETEKLEPYATEPPKCPRCMPETFRAHVRAYHQGTGCFFNPKAAKVPKAPKHADQAANF